MTLKATWYHECDHCGKRTLAGIETIGDTTSARPPSAPSGWTTLTHFQTQAGTFTITAQHEYHFCSPTCHQTWRDAQTATEEKE